MKRMRTIVALAVAAAALAGVAAFSRTSAQTPPMPASSTIGVVDVVKIFDNYERVRAFDLEMRTRSTEVQTQDDNLAKQIESMERKLSDLAPGSKEAEALVDQMMQLSVQRQTLTKMHEGRVTRDRYRLSEEVYQEMLKIIEAIAQERGLDMVFSGDSFAVGAKLDVYRQIERKKVLFNRANLDLTKEVLERLNNAYKP